MKVDNVILALDVPDAEQALHWVQRLNGRVGCFKIGLQLFSKAGAPLVRKIREMGAEVFLDVKFLDIPNTVARAVESVASLDLKFITIHTLGGHNMIQEALSACPSRTTLLGVTVLTSLCDEDMKALGFQNSPSQQVLQLARVGQGAGLKALVCSPLEVTAIREEFQNDFILVTPGVRPAGSSQDDQSRVTTPQRAIEMGSDYVVMGRPILKAEKPEALLDSLYEA